MIQLIDTSAVAKYVIHVDEIYTENLKHRMNQICSVSEK